MLRDEQNAYTEQRIPSYCDRILWNSHPERLGHIRQLQLESVPSMMSSDHKPVTSVFTIDIPVSATALPENQPQDAPDIVLTDVEGFSKGRSKIIAADISSSDPYLRFTSNVLNKKYKSLVKPSTLNPKWDDDEIPLLQSMVSSPDMPNTSDTHTRLLTRVNCPRVRCA